MGACACTASIRRRPTATSSRRAASSNRADERRRFRSHRTAERFRAPHERGRARPRRTSCPAEGCRDADPGRPLGRDAEGAARQAPCAAQVHAGQVRVSRRRRRSCRQAHADRDARSIRQRRDAADAALPQGQRRAGPRAGARRDPRDLRGDRPAARHARRGRRPCRTGPGRRSRSTGAARPAAHPFRRPRHHAAGAAAPLRYALLHHGCERDRARIEGVTGPDAELVELVWMPLDRGQAARHAGRHRRDAGGARRPHRRRLRPRPAGAVLPDDPRQASVRELL